MTLSDILVGSWEVFHYTWRALQMGCRGNRFLQMELELWFYDTLFAFGDANAASNFLHESHFRSDSMDTPSTNLQPHENSFGELSKYSGTPIWSPKNVQIIAPLYTLPRILFPKVHFPFDET